MICLQLKLHCLQMAFNTFCGMPQSFCHNKVPKKLVIDLTFEDFCSMQVFPEQGWHTKFVYSHKIY
jgi:hypothetical protein